ARRMDRCDPKSHSTRSTSAPWVACSSSRAASPRARSRQTSVTFAPIFASSRAVILPMPELAPVTIATFPFMMRRWRSRRRAASRHLERAYFRPVVRRRIAAKAWARIHQASVLLGDGGGRIVGRRAAAAGESRDDGRLSTFLCLEEGGLDFVVELW